MATRKVPVHDLLYDWYLATETRSCFALRAVTDLVIKRVRRQVGPICGFRWNIPHVCKLPDHSSSCESLGGFRMSRSAMTALLSVLAVAGYRESRKDRRGSQRPRRERSATHRPECRPHKRPDRIRTAGWPRRSAWRLGRLRRAGRSWRSPARDFRRWRYLERRPWWAAGPVQPDRPRRDGEVLGSGRSQRRDRQSGPVGSTRSRCAPGHRLADWTDFRRRSSVVCHETFRKPSMA